jgi:hypothetical protein
MIGFLNERSLEEHVNWEAALRLFLDAAQELLAVQAPLMKDSTFFLDANFKKRFGSLSFRGDVQGLIRQVVFSERYYRCWRPGRTSVDVDEYLCDDPRLELRDESLGEATEVKLRDRALDAAVLSAADSEFRNQDQLAVSKNSSGNQALLRNITSLELVKRWLTQQRGYYAPDSRDSPKDFQTVLEKAPQRFRFTGKVERRGSRKIFEERETGRLYYVCDAHSGRSAHLEVFAANDQHLGKADINTGDVNVSQRIKGRTLKL